MKFTLMFVLAFLPFGAFAQPKPRMAGKPAAVVAGEPGKAEANTAKGEPAKPEAKPEDEPKSRIIIIKEDMQMTEEELAKARAEDEALMRKSAAEDAAAERQRQQEARMALCVIRPVMSDEQIDYCRVAYRD